ncbi:hypothetical protein jhhlp_000900 [Lomentospora prolificans]|uniref:ADP-ribosylation factor-like protein 3 n=1 Tax=Lomentospora prolificans TaxID=41688 RepID=A0A2N3NK09_9PEZI|nr:hypothetical protein jhhlp_000900 [Lomentospora prolificans]
MYSTLLAGGTTTSRNVGCNIDFDPAIASFDSLPQNLPRPLHDCHSNYSLRRSLSRSCTTSRRVSTSSRQAKKARKPAICLPHTLPPHSPRGSAYIQLSANPPEPTEYSVILLGLDNAGKTTFHEQVKALFNPDQPSPRLKTVPTVGQNVSTVTLPDMYLKIWDVGGQMSLRKLWQSYYSSCHAIVFIIDSTDIGDGDLAEEDDDDPARAERTVSGRLDECRLVLEDVLQNEETEGVPLLILANKQDREDCVEVVRIKEGLVKKVFEGEKASSIRDSRVLPVSALTGSGVREAVDWVRSRVKWNKESRPPVMR